MCFCTPDLDGVCAFVCENSQHVQQKDALTCSTHAKPLPVPGSNMLLATPLCTSRVSKHRAKNTLTRRAAGLVLDGVVRPVVDEELSHLPARVVRHGEVKAGVPTRVSVVDVCPALHQELHHAHLSRRQKIVGEHTRQGTARVSRGGCSFTAFLCEEFREMEDGYS